MSKLDKVTVPKRKPPHPTKGKDKIEEFMRQHGDKYPLTKIGYENAPIHDLPNTRYSRSPGTAVAGFYAKEGFPSKMGRHMRGMSMDPREGDVVLLDRGSPSNGLPVLGTARHELDHAGINALKPENFKGDVVKYIEDLQYENEDQVRQRDYALGTDKDREKSISYYRDILKKPNYLELAQGGIDDILKLQAVADAHNIREGGEQAPIHFPEDIYKSIIAPALEARDGKASSPRNPNEGSSGGIMSLLKSLF